MSERLPPRIVPLSRDQRIQRLNRSIAELEAARRSPNHHDDLLRALRAERDDLLAMAPGTAPTKDRPR